MIHGAGACRNPSFVGVIIALVPARRAARVDLAGALRGSNPPELAGVRGHAILLVSAEKQLDFRPLTFQVQLWKLTLTHCPVRTAHGFYRYYYLDDNY